MALADFTAATQAWFAAELGSPTPAQAEAWASIASGEHTLVSAPTGSGKTLAAFLWAIDRLHAEPAVCDDSPASQGRALSASGGARGTQILYISPLKALAEDVRRNLEVPLDGIAQVARRTGSEVPEISVGLRSGDTSAAGRRELLRKPPDILITTPESLFLMLTSKARETLVNVRTVIVDEVHDLVGTKRGAHLALSLARLDVALGRPAQRVGLSATVRPLEAAAQFLHPHGLGPQVRVVAPPAAKTWDLSVRAVVADLSRLDEEVAASGRNSVWPKAEQAVLDVALAHRSSIVFVNSRTTAERVVAALNERYAALTAAEDVLEPPRNSVVNGGMSAQISSTTYTSDGAGPIFAKAHHGSVSKESRALVEADLKAGRLRCVVATSSLELGIDMGSVDVVVQLGAPPSVASGLQRVGRAGHQVGAVSHGVVFPLHRLDVAHCAVIVRRMRDGAIESLKVLQNPLDVLAQHTVSAAAAGGEAGLDVEEWFETVRAAAPFHNLPRAAYESVLDLLSGKYPADFFGELRPRLVWDRVKNTMTARPGAAMLAAISGGTIPDRGLYGVFLVGEASSRVGELDEEMVYESRAGDVIQLGAASWRIMEITHDRVLVAPAPGSPARLSFWKGDGPGRPAELGRAVGQFFRECDGFGECDGPGDLPAGDLDQNAAANLVSLLAEQRAATTVVPTDETLVVEQFRDPLGDWHVALLSPYGGSVHAPWALAVAARLRERYGVDESPAVNDDGIVVRLPGGDDDRAAPAGAELFAFDPGEIERIVERELGGSALFAARFRECSARALLLPRRRPGQRTALWLQRLRSAQLLDVARGYPQFPMLLEAMRECLQDVYDLPALKGLLARIEGGGLRLVEVATPVPSPFARSLLFGYDGLHMYEDDRPLAERRAAALRVDEGLLGELLGRGEAQDFLDPEVVRRTELELQRLAPDRRARNEEAVADLLRELGPLTGEEVAERSAKTASLNGPSTWLAALAEAGRVITFERGGRQWWAAVEDAGRLRDALGVTADPSVPEVFLAPVQDPFGDLVSRYARTHGPFSTEAVATRFGLGGAIVAEALNRLEAIGRGRSSDEWCSREVMRRLRRGSLAALRQEIEPVGHAAFARFLLRWQHIGRPLRGFDGLLDAIDQLAGVRLPVSALEALILPARVADYTPALLDEAFAAGEAYWTGAGEGWVRLHPADLAPWAELPVESEPDDDLARMMLEALSGGGAFFLAQIGRAVATAEGTAAADALPTERQLHEALRALAWSGRVTSDTFAPVREWAAPARKSTPQGASRLQRRGSNLRRRPRLTAPRLTGQGVSGRWALTPQREQDPTVRAAAMAHVLLDRYGVVSRDVVAAEEVGFGVLYQVLTAMEEMGTGDGGTCRRGYFVDSLGGAQFAAGSTVDMLRGQSGDESEAVALAATDPANPYGAALRWPEHPSARPGRKAGAIVVLVGGELALYLERGGASLASFPVEGAAKAAEALAQAGRRLGGLVLERLDGESVHGARSDALNALIAAGFAPVPRGLRLR